MNAINARTRNAIKANPTRNAPRHMTITRLQTLDDFVNVSIRFELERRDGSHEEYSGVVLSTPFHQVYENVEYVWFCVKAARILEPIMIRDTQLRGFVSPFIGLKEVE